MYEKRTFLTKLIHPETAKFNDYHVKNTSAHKSVWQQKAFQHSSDLGAKQI